jgi:hypothetical protein
VDVGGALDHPERDAPSVEHGMMALRAPFAAIHRVRAIALALLLQQLRGAESERSFLREAQRFYSPLFPEVAGLYPSPFDRRVRKPRRFLEPLRREILPKLVVGEPETPIVATLLEVFHPRGKPGGRQASQERHG